MITSDVVQPPSLKELWDAYHKACEEWRKPIRDLEHERNHGLLEPGQSNSYRKRRKAQIFNELKDLRSRPFPEAPQNENSSGLRDKLPSKALNTLCMLSMLSAGLRK
jgi:hypothetical protein